MRPFNCLGTLVYQIYSICLNDIDQGIIIQAIRRKLMKDSTKEPEFRLHCICIL